MLIFRLVIGLRIILFEVYLYLVDKSVEGLLNTYREDCRGSCDAVSQVICKEEEEAEIYAFN